MLASYKKKKYLIVSIIFLIGVIVATIFINKISEEQKMEITTYMDLMAIMLFLQEMAITILMVEKAMTPF